MPQSGPFARSRGLRVNISRSPAPLGACTSIGTALRPLFRRPSVSNSHLSSVLIAYLHYRGEGSTSCLDFFISSLRRGRCIRKVIKSEYNYEMKVRSMKKCNRNEKLVPLFREATRKVTELVEGPDGTTHNKYAA